MYWWCRSPAVTAAQGISCTLSAATSWLRRCWFQGGMFTVPGAQSTALGASGDNCPAAQPSPAGNGWGLTIVADVTDRTGAIL